MKKLLAILMALVLMLSCAAAVAEEPEIIQIGEGEKVILLFMIVGDEQIVASVYTDKEYVMDALLDYGLIEVEQESWGYNVTTVATVNASKEVPGAYWGIYTLEGEEMVRLSTPIESTPIGDVFVCAFVLEM